MLNNQKEKRTFALIFNQITMSIDTVSYTHLTLPTT